MSIPITPFRAFEVTILTGEFFGVFWRKIHSKMFYIYRTKKTPKLFLIKIKKNIVTFFQKLFL
jgi:hypothetical protein